MTLCRSFDTPLCLVSGRVYALRGRRAPRGCRVPGLSTISRNNDPRRRFFSVSIRHKRYNTVAVSSRRTMSACLWRNHFRNRVARYTRYVDCLRAIILCVLFFFLSVVSYRTGVVIFSEEALLSIAVLFVCAVKRHSDTIYM